MTFSLATITTTSGMKRKSFQVYDGGCGGGGGGSGLTNQNQKRKEAPIM